MVVVKLDNIIRGLGDYISEAVLIAEAEPVDHPGPRVVWCNKSFSEMTGYPIDEIIGQTPRILQGEETDPETRARIRRKLENWEPVREQVLNYRKNGEIFWVELDIRPIADESGWFHYWLSIQRDITDRKNAELELKRERDRFDQQRRELKEQREAALLQSLVARHTTDIAVITDTSGLIVWVNDAFEACTGHLRQEVIGKKPGSVLQGEETDPETRNVISAAIREAKPCQVEILNYTRRGHPYWIDLRITPVFDENGEHVFFVAVEQDITDRKQISDALVEKGNELEAALEDSKRAVASLRSYRTALDCNAIVAITDRRGKITEVNEFFCKISGYSEEELIGRTHSLLNSGYHPPEFFKELWRTIASGEIWRGEICNKSKSGALYWVDTAIVPLKDESDQITNFVAIRYDITEKKAAADQLYESKTRLAMATEAGSEGSWQYDSSESEVYCSDTHFRNLGEPIPAQRSMSMEAWISRVHPEDKAAFKTAFDRLSN